MHWAPLTPGAPTQQWSWTLLGSGVGDNHVQCGIAAMDGCECFERSRWTGANVWYGLGRQVLYGLCHAVCDLLAKKVVASVAIRLVVSV